MAVTANLSEQLEALVGKRIGPYFGFHPVSRVQVWQWCSAMGDNNPLYLDDDYRAGIGMDARVVAPPAMAQMWTMRDVHMQWAPGSTEERPYPVIDFLENNGYPGNVAVSYDLHFQRLLREGDEVAMYKSVASISELKQTALGEGYFFTDKAEYVDGDGEPFAEALITYFQYRPAEAGKDAGAAQPEQGTPPAAAAVWRSDFTDVRAEQLAPGQALPELAIPITHKLIVSGAAASQDFVDGHHNEPAARAAAMPDIFMNILTTCGLAGRYLTDWAGPGSRLQKLSFKLMAPNVPGDTMVFKGAVKRVTDAAQERLAG